MSAITFYIKQDLPSRQEKNRMKIKTLINDAIFLLAIELTVAI
jgi:hypothetical protein